MNLWRRNESKPVGAGDLAIRLGDTGPDGIRPTRWGLILVIFMRLMAALWLAQGLREWATVLLPAETVLDSLSGAAAGAVIFFATADLLAAVGLWLATPWGGALWLFAAVSQIFVAMTVKGVFGGVWIAVDVILIIIYFALTFQAGQANDA